ncbi:HTH domain-containing protein [Haloplanus sp.]|uniref:HTH domain-containing protein n=1 Tax=Haloplanus sp. TaxID=1961696 RepID=UPI0026073439|nr:HTH domain-containing protein [Haloplanus sp.]
MTRHKPHVAIDCYVRASAALDQVDDLLEAVHEYADAGLVDGYSIDIWPDRIRLGDTEGSAAVIDDYERFRAWADNDGVSLEPAFEHRTRTTMAGDDPDAFLVLPVVCLAVRVDGDLVTVAPHTTDTTAYTAADALSDVESLLDQDGRPARVLEDLPPDHPVRTALKKGGEQSGTEPDERPTTEQ